MTSGTYDERLVLEGKSNPNPSRRRKTCGKEAAYGIGDEVTSSLAAVPCINADASSTAFTGARTVFFGAANAMEGGSGEGCEESDRDKRDGVHFEGCGQVIGILSGYLVGHAEVCKILYDIKTWSQPWRDQAAYIDFRRLTISVCL